MANIVKDVNTVLEKYSVVIFDFDGTLINSEPAHMHGHMVMLSAILGYDIPDFEKLFQSKYIGKRDSVLFDEYMADFGFSADKDIMLQLKSQASVSKIINGKDNMLVYIDDLLRCKGDRKYYILSNNNRYFIDKVLEAKGYTDMFDDIFSMDAMGITKDYFMEHIGEYIVDVVVDKLIVFEDSISQLQYLVDRGYHTVGVENMFNVGKINSAEYIINDGFREE